MSIEGTFVRTTIPYALRWGAGDLEIRVEDKVFEALVDEVVARYYRSRGLSKVQIDNKLKAGLQGLIKNHLPRCCRYSFVGAPEHATWNSDLYQLRNHVVHDGALVDASQARRALDAAEQALLWMRTHCP